jgi:hypothetical protein
MIFVICDHGPWTMVYGLDRLKLDVAGRFELPFGVLQTPTSPLGHATLKKTINHLKRPEDGG